MKKILSAVLILGVTSGLAMAGFGKTPECPMRGRTKKCGLCPETMKGVKTAAVNTANGVEITLTAKDKETVERVQEMAMVHYTAKDNLDVNCPGRVEGARTKVTNTETGVKVEITGDTPEMIRKIQEASLKGHKLSAPAKEMKKGSKKGSKKMGTKEKK